MVENNSSEQYGAGFPASPDYGSGSCPGCGPGGNPALFRFGPGYDSCPCPGFGRLSVSPGSGFTQPLVRIRSRFLSGSVPVSVPVWSRVVLAVVPGVALGCNPGFGPGCGFGSCPGLGFQKGEAKETAPYTQSQFGCGIGFGFGRGFGILFLIILILLLFPGFFNGY